MRIAPKLKKIIFAVLFSLFISCGFDSSTKANTISTDSKFKVERVQIKKESEFAWSVVGMIRNQSSSDVKGHVKIKFLNSAGDILNTAKAKVNDGDSFFSGQAASFEYFTEPSKFEGVTNFDVEFVEK